MTRESCGGGTIPKQTFFNLDKDKQDRIIECAIDEFSARNFENSKLSNIIKNAKISRGSLYQYFEDKFDIYIYIMELTKNEKLKYMSPHLANPKAIPFIELFKEMYVSGIRFAIDNPKLVKMMTHLLSTKGEIYDRVMKDGLQLAIDMYTNLIELDKKAGRIKKNIDSKIFAQLVIDMTVNVSVNELDRDKSEFNFDKMLERITQIIDIIGYGVTEEE
ncbi:TetR/AcrR family transcriptional regulator [Mycoplasmatota bacterium WC30]